MDRTEIDAEWSRVQADYTELVSRAPDADLRRSSGTRWTNQQLLFHMVFGYLIVRTLMPLVHLLGRAIQAVGRRLHAAELRCHIGIPCLPLPLVSALDAYG